MIKNNLTGPIAVLIGVGLLAGCSNGTSVSDDVNATRQSGQAIDGYIVGASVFCDGISNGRTLAAGRFECPSDTSIVRIRGGSDVGFDATATSGGTPFSGELKAPGGAPYVTPLSTIATNMAEQNGSVSAADYLAAVDTLAVSLDSPNLNLGVNPATNLGVAQLNAQVNQLISNFSDNALDYASVSKQLSKVLAVQTSFDLTGDTTTIVSALNQRLVATAPALALSPSAEIEVAQELAVVNAAIKNSSSVTQIVSVVNVGAAASGHVFSLIQTAPLVRFKNAYQSLSGTVSTKYFNLKDFQNASLSNQSYLVDTGANFNSVEFSTDGFTVNSTLDDIPVSVAVEFVSTIPADNRKISVTMSGAKLTMKAGDNKSVRITVPPAAIVNARAADEFGVITNATLSAKKTYLATNEDGNFEFSMSNLENELESRGYYNFTSEIGNYRLTLVVSGVSFGVTSALGVESRAQQYTIETINERVTGDGIQGYFTTR